MKEFEIWSVGYLNILLLTPMSLHEFWKETIIKYYMVIKINAEILTQFYHKF